MHGIQLIEINTGVGAVQTVSSSIVGFVATGPAADVAAFPVDTPVLITDLDTAIAKAGATGTLRATLEAIRSQASPVCVIVRVAEGANAEDTTDNVAAGVVILSQAPQRIGVRPRILGAPGLDTAEVRAALAVAAGKDKLDGMAYVASIGDDVAEKVLDRATVSAREITLIAGDFMNGNTRLRATAVALGLRARIDQEQGPQKSLSNVAVQGVTGLSDAITFDLVDGSTDAGVLNDADVVALVNLRGFRFWGNRTASDDSLFAFEPTVRVGQLIRDRIAAAVVTFLDKPMHPSLARDLVEFINGELAQLQAAGVILGGKAWLDKQLNDVNGLRTGRLAIDFDYTVPPPLENLQLRQRVTDRYLADFTEQASA